MASRFQSWIQLEKYLDYLRRNVVGPTEILNEEVLEYTRVYAERLNSGLIKFSEAYVPSIPILDNQIDIFMKLLLGIKPSIQSSAFRGMLKDYFYTNTLNANLLFLAFDAGIMIDVEKAEVLDEPFRQRYIKRLMSDYGLTTAAAEWAVGMWIQCYGINILRKQTS